MILTVDDLGALLDRYEDNPTMRRLIAQHVEKLLKDTNDTQTRRELIAVRQKAVANDISGLFANGGRESTVYEHLTEKNQGFPPHRRR